MKGDSSTNCWGKVGSEWIEKAQTNDFRIHYLMPYTLQKLGKVEGLDVLDLGCGEGGYSRELAARGAKVTAADCSEMAIAYAAFAAKEKDLDISCLVRNSNDLYGIQKDSFDIVLCAMMLMDVEDFDGTMKEIHRVLRPDGKVFISVLHPCFKPPVEHKWFKENSSVQVIVRNYFEPEVWTGEIAGISREIIYRHRTMSDYVKVFVRNKFKIIDLNEPKPTEEQRKMSPRIEWLTKIPMYMFIELAKD